MDRLFSCITTSWQPGIGDPNATGWLTVGMYLLTSALAIWVLRRQGRSAGRGFWIFIVLMMLALAVNKQLDLQSALTAAGRCLARMQGWYDDRRAVQEMFIAWTAVIMLLTVLLMAAILRRHLARNWVALLGLGVLCGFIVMRAAGFHNFDLLIGRAIAGNVRLNFLFENAGLLMIAGNAIWLARQEPPSRRRRRRRHGSRGEPVRQKRRSSRGRPSDGPQRPPPLPSQAT